MVALLSVLVPSLLLAVPPQKDLTWVDLLRTRTTWDGAPIHFPATAKPEVQAKILELAPGASNPWHKHPVNAYVYILQGDFRVELEDGTIRDFHAGDAYAQVVETWHRGTNRGRTPMRAVIFFLGEADAPLTLTRPATVISGK
jgi:quercetin dioxygenase-like cupin family protein